MPAEDLTNVQLGQQGQLNNATGGQVQGQTQGDLSGSPVGPLDANSDSGTEVLTGSAPQAGYADETIDNAGTDNFAAEADKTVERLSQITRQSQPVPLILETATGTWTTKMTATCKSKPPRTSTEMEFRIAARPRTKRTLSLFSINYR